MQIIKYKLKPLERRKQQCNSILFQFPEKQFDIEGTICTHINAYKIYNKLV